MLDAVVFPVCQVPQCPQRIRDRFLIAAQENLVDYRIELFDLCKRKLSHCFISQAAEIGRIQMEEIRLKEWRDLGVLACQE